MSSIAFLRFRTTLVQKNLSVNARPGERGSFIFMYLYFVFLKKKIKKERERADSLSRAHFEDRFPLAAGPSGDAKASDK